MAKETQIYQILMPKLLPSVHNNEQFVILFYLQASKLVCIVSWTDWRHETPIAQRQRMLFLTAGVVTKALWLSVLVPPPFPFTKSEGLHYRREILHYGNHHSHSKWKQVCFVLEGWTGWLLCSCSVVSDSLQPYRLQHSKLPCPSPSPEAYSNSCPLNWWCHPTNLSSLAPFFSWLLSFPASGSFPMSWFFASGGQGIGASASALPVNIQSWFPLGLTGLISLQSKGLSRVLFSSKPSVLQHLAFFIVQLSHPYMTTGKTIAFSSGEGREIVSFIKVAFCS